MKNDKYKVIAFPHPGDEHLIRNIKWECVDSDNISDYSDSKERIKLGTKRYKEFVKKNSGIMWWNNSVHQRKFLKCDGLFIDKTFYDMKNNDAYKAKEGELLFWGEMEYPTQMNKIKYSVQTDSKWPLYIHTPINQRRIDVKNLEDEDLFKLYGAMYEQNNIRIYDPEIGLQNTDPYVFGNSFFYSCCKQRKCNKPTILQNLNPGDLIVFYSYKKCDSGFVCMLDTIFVIGEKIGEFKKNSYSKIKNSISDLYFQNVVMPIFYGNGGSLDNDGCFTLYRSATYRNPINGMFSYFPCKIYSGNENCGFPRYEIKNGILQGDIVLKSKQGFAVNNVDNVFYIWRCLTQDILDAGYNLGVTAFEPQIID